MEKNMDMNNLINKQFDKKLLKESLKEFIDNTRQTIESKILEVFTTLQSMKENTDQNIAKCN